MKARKGWKLYSQTAFLIIKLLLLLLLPGTVLLLLFCYYYTERHHHNCDTSCDTVKDVYNIIFLYTQYIHISQAYKLHSKRDRYYLFLIISYQQRIKYRR